MVREIHLKELADCPDKDWLGNTPSREDFDELITEDCDVYLPDGTHALAFRKGVLEQVTAIQQGSSDFDYWRWACRSLLSDQRGFAAGKEIRTNVEIRFTYGQDEFFRQAKKGNVTTLDEALSIVNADTRPCRKTYYINKTESDGLVDLEEIEKWNSLVRKKSTPFELREEAVAKRNAFKLAWFDNWLRTVWAVADDKVAAAKNGWDRYHTNQPRSNKAYSAVLGTIDRSARMPFGRLTKPTLEKYEEFCSYSPLYREVSDWVKNVLPEQWGVLSERFANVKDPRYNLFGTVFTSITANYNFDVAYHYDANNAQDAVAALTVFEGGRYEGGEFVLPQLRLAFDIRHGDLLAGDNQGLMHGMLPLVPKSEDAECLMLVFYQRDRIIDLDDLECEACRKAFMDYSMENLKHYGSGEPKWAGSYEHMWASPEWITFKKEKGMERCSNTNYYCREDSWQG